MSESNRLENIEVSVVIPCLNEANSLALCVDKARNAFASSGIRGEVVVADNGSTDGSIELAEEHGARVVHVKDRGYGSALRGGIAASRGEFIIMGDADDGYDVVMGNRFRGEIKPGAMPWSHRYIGNPGLTAVMNIFFRTGTGDCLC